MATRKQILILANSVRLKKHCVAGKEVWLRGNHQYEVGKWIRLIDPKDPQGAVSDRSTFCKGHGRVRPLNIIEVTTSGYCNNADHPEDWYFDPAIPWRFVANAHFSYLQSIQDKPRFLWADTSKPSKPNAVHTGYVSQMKEPASLYLIKAPLDWKFSFWEESVPDDDNPGQRKKKSHRELSFTYNGIYHELSVTDPEFGEKYNIFDRMTSTPQTLQVKNPEDVYFCVSLTPDFRGKQYKIGATIFEP